MATPARHVRPETAAQRRAIYHEALAMLAAGYGADVTIDHVAGSLATSRRQLQRAFEETGGTTFSAHLTAVRMRRAALLLTQSP